MFAHFVANATMKADFRMSDRTAQATSGMVVGTAGHIDHGKTSLVRALTGIDTDRLAEEKLRGISIDLGFAHASLPDGRHISFIDVPGHERFVKNMLAGAAGIKAVLLVVAADEGVKPQTREHFEICRLLGIEHGVIVLTKTDLANQEQIAYTKKAVQELCGGSFLGAAPVVPVSVVSGDGMMQLKSELSKLVTREVSANHDGLPRLPLDRSFVLKGFGTVVTGTLWSGRLRTGDMVQIHPGKKTARIRGLQVHGQAVETASAGQRTAVNLAGIDHTEIRRGFVLTRPDTFETSCVLDVLVDWLEHVDIPSRRTQVLFHSGTAEYSSALKIFSYDAKGRNTLARLWLSGPVIAIPGDRFVLRSPSPAQTVAGGFVIDAFPRQRLSRTKNVLRMQTLLEADLPRRIQFLVEESGTGCRVPELVRFTGAPPDLIKSLIAQNQELTFIETAQRALAKTWIRSRREKLIEWLRAFHAKNPSAPGAPIAAARLGLDASLANAVFDGMAEIRMQGDVIALAGHRVQFTNQEAQALSRMEQIFRTAGFQPPALADALKMSGVDAKKARALLENLIRNQRLARVSEELIFHAEVLAHIRQSLAAHRGRRFSVPEFKEWTQISRKYAIPLLEYLDRQRVTRREGDSRIVL
jgi:selenocysteine-specific elongation factor